MLPDAVSGVAFRAGGLSAVKVLWPETQDPKTVVSSGPFKLESYVKGAKVSLVKNPFYGEWVEDSSGVALPYLDGVSYTFENDSNKRLELYQKGEVDVFNPFGNQIPPLVAAPPALSTLLPSAGSTSSD